LLQARWFGIHVIANVWIALLCLPDVVYMVSDPLGALGEKRLNHWPASFIFSVHVYHASCQHPPLRSSACARSRSSPLYVG